MIDFHTHILPGIDDGSPNVETSVAMLRAERDAGISEVVFTPHFYAAQTNPADFVKKRAEAWRTLAPKLTDDMPKVAFGAEVLYFEGIARADSLSRLCVVGTDFLLLEMPFRHWTDRMVDDVMTLTARTDIKLVMAHIERYLTYITPDVLSDICGSGALVQINTSMFEDRRTKQIAMKLISRDNVHLFGTDCHSMKHRRPDWKILPEEARRLVEQNRKYRDVEKAIKSVAI